MKKYEKNTVVVYIDDTDKEPYFITKVVYPDLGQEITSTFESSELDVLKRFLDCYITRENFEVRYEQL